MMDDITDSQVGAWRTAAKGLVRGGHKDEPSMEVQVAATNWIIQQQLARYLLEAIETGDRHAALKVEDGRLFFVADGLEDGIELAVVEEPAVA